MSPATNPLAPLIETPYYAVIFSSLRTELDDDGYAIMAERMVDLASQQPGFLGIESTRASDGFGITVSYWQSLDAIRLWREQAEHRLAQAGGRSSWYQTYRLRVCRVDRDAQFERET